MGKKRLTYWGLLPLAVLLAGCMADYEERPDATGGGLDGLVPIYMTASVLEAEADKGGAGTRAGADVQSSQLASGETFTVAFSGNAQIEELVRANMEKIAGDVLADAIVFDEEFEIAKEWSLNGEKVTISVKR